MSGIPGRTRPREDRELVVALFESGVAVKEIERRTGVPYATAYRWCHPAAEAQSRARARDWKARNRERNRARNRAYKHDPKQRGECATCGGLMGAGYADGTCHSCRVARKEARWERIEYLWTSGATYREIQAELGLTKGHLCVELGRMRKAGRNVPPRPPGGLRRGRNGGASS